MGAPRRAARPPLALSVALVLALGACSSGEASDSASSASPTADATASTAVPASSAEPTVTGEPLPTGPETPSAQASQDATALSQGDISADELPPVAPDQTSTVDGADIALGTMRSEDLKAGPGETGGPGVVIPVKITNNTGSELSLSGLVVTVTYGADKSPAAELVSAYGEVPDSVAPGETQTVEKAFTIPASGRGQVHVVVDLGPDHAAATFDGAAPS
ncbi:hypothetical protein [Actinomyces marmotae]|uniref:DUF4352 domain-containing protein n=2 Tax=Actinomyces TaxID=1654 RepID=A0A6M8B327_9ACTO|nr:hypothetical protein [Actinomyces marmotae]QKD80312.1 hypothetical protein HPC72_08880 [Actinomyces marmotae]